MTKKQLERYFFAYLLTKACMTLVMQGDYASGYLGLAGIALWLLSTHLAWWGYRHQEAGPLRSAWFLDWGLLALGVVRFVLSQLLMPITHMRYLAHRDVGQLALENLLITGLFYVGLPALGLWLLWRVRQSSPGNTDGNPATGTTGNQAPLPHPTPVVDSVGERESQSDPAEAPDQAVANEVAPDQQRGDEVTQD